MHNICIRMVNNKQKCLKREISRNYVTYGEAIQCKTQNGAYIKIKL